MPNVSVPLRGKYRGEAFFMICVRSIGSVVSVPLRGKYRGEELEYTNVIDRAITLSFRPLAG